MGVEIERKFLVDKALFDLAKRGVEPVEIVQGYLESTGCATVRVRIAGEKAFLTVKGKTVGFSRAEFEYEIPPEDAREMLAMCSARIEKKRYLLPHRGHIWEIDVFSGANDGLVMAEVELASESETVELPEFIAGEVTGERRYYNGNLARNPFSGWFSRPPRP